jgi:aryl-alcohol dehydrogenase-like predicted oxidoreductase
MFEKEAYIANLETVEKWKSIAADKIVTLPQLTLAWL